MPKNFLWCGYLEAGDKSTPVVIDERLDTGNADTMYVFNFRRNGILTYNRDIVKAKLRELRGDEEGVVPELKNAYTKARRGFRLRNEPVVVTATAARRQKVVNERSATDDSGDLADLGVEFEAVTDDDWGDDSEA